MHGVLFARKALCGRHDRNGLVGTVLVKPEEIKSVDMRSAAFLVADDPKIPNKL
jgi:hypothetical protein